MIETMILILGFTLLLIGYMEYHFVLVKARTRIYLDNVNEEINEVRNLKESK